MGWSTETAGTVLGVMAGILLLAFLQVPLTNWGPAWSLRAWTRIIRFFKKGDRKPWSWSTIEEGKLYISSLPSSMGELEELLKPPHNLKAVLSVNEAWELRISRADFEARGVDYKHVPVPDYSAPSLPAIIEAVKWIHGRNRSGGAVLVHCNAGRGRSVVMALGYLLVAKEGWDSAKAFEHVSSRRKVAALRIMWGTRPQWRSLKKFEKWLGKQAGGGWLQEVGAKQRTAEDVVIPAAMRTPRLEGNETELQGTPTTGKGETHVVDISLSQSPGVDIEQTPAARGRVPEVDGGGVQVAEGDVDGGVGVRVRINMGAAAAVETDLPGTPVRGGQGGGGSMES